MSSTETTRATPHAASTSSPSAAGCCGGPAPRGTVGCCARDADLKAAGGAGCGCGTPVPVPPTPARARSGCC